jgi:polyadenylate-binding protein
VQVTSEALRESFCKYGEIASAIVQYDQTGVSRGFGFVNFSRPQDADAAVAQHTGSPWLVRSLMMSLMCRSPWSGPP